MSRTAAFAKGLTSVTLRIARTAFLAHNEYWLPLILFIISFGIFYVAREASALNVPQRFTLLWDATWYAGIIDGGYMTDGNIDVQHNVVFFPLYPAICYAAICLFGLPTFDAMQLVSVISSLMAFVLLYKTFLRHCSRRTASFAILLLALNPYAVFFFNCYTEALFLFLIALFFYLLLNRSAYLASALVVGCASAVRPYGCVLGAILAFELLRRHVENSGWRLDLESRFLRLVLLSTPLCFTGLVAYTLWLGDRFGDPLAFTHNLRAWGTVPAHGIDLSNLLLFKYAARGMARAISQSVILSPMLTGLLLFLATPVLLFLTIRKTHPAFGFFLLLMFSLLHFIAHRNPSTVPDLGRHLMVVFPWAIATAMVLDPENVSRWIRRTMPESVREQEDSPLWLLVCSIPLYGMLLIEAALYFRNTFMYFRANFV